MSDVIITTGENGPLTVKGPITLLDHEGNAHTLEGSRVYLCRCGGSKNKPFCDGTHNELGFAAADLAPVGEGPAS
jgi:CDGSH-type Zn-finger protein